MLLAVASASGWRSLEGDDELDAEAATPPGVLSTASDDLTLRARALAKETSLGKAVRRASGRLAGDAATGDAAAERAREGPREALCEDDERAAACESHVNFGDLPKLGDRRVSLTPRPASSQSALAHRDADAKPPMLLVVDARSPLAVKGNQIAGGKGTETLEHYEGVRISVLWP
ncbi:phosphatidylinositol-3,5-bisphosphate 3-phosphatase [Aureococcus anophagefferens]|nr:phosphatidylinositol-3,5-bisphosphate 3-phosphatase [Aureococcus anophagefferens]